MKIKLRNLALKFLMITFDSLALLLYIAVVYALLVYISVLTNPTLSYGILLVCAFLFAFISNEMYKDYKKFAKEVDNLEDERNFHYIMNRYTDDTN